MKFVRHAKHRKKRIARSSYRRPRGWQNKQRLEKRGSTPRVKAGYMTKKSERGKKRGLEIVRVHNVADVDAIDPKTQGVLLARIGMKKKIAVLKRIAERKLTYFRGDPAAEAKKYEETFAASRKETAEKAKEKEAAQKELEKVAKEKEAEQAEADKADDAEEADGSEKVAEQKKSEEKDKDKVLTGK